MGGEGGWSSPYNPHTSAEQQCILLVAVKRREPQAIQLQQRSRRACCMGRAVSSVYLSFLPFVKEALSHDPSMHFKSLLQDKCKNTCICM